MVRTNFETGPKIGGRPQSERKKRHWFSEPNRKTLTLFSRGPPVRRKSVEGPGTVAMFPAALVTLAGQSHPPEARFPVPVLPFSVLTVLEKLFGILGKKNGLRLRCSGASHMRFYSNSSTAVLSASLISKCWGQFSSQTPHSRHCDAGLPSPTALL